MNCQQSEERINELLDRRRSLRNDRDLNDHRLSCAACDQLAHDYEMLTDYFESKSGQTSGLRPARLASAEATAWRRESSWTRRRLWTVAAIAATLLVVAIPLTEFPKSTPTNRIADSNAPLLMPKPVNPTEEVAWPELLATIEELPRHWESLGPVYACTAQMTGVSSLTSPLNLTMDWLKWNWSRIEQWPDWDDSHGRLDRFAGLERTA